MFDSPSITGLMLAGGRGQRIGGADKGLLPLAGSNLASHTLQRLASQTHDQLISANRSLDEYGALGVPVLTDRREGFAGPLAGIETALYAMQNDWLLVVPCDSPVLPLDLADRLMAALHAHRADIAIARDGDRLHFLHALIPRRLLTDLSLYLDQGQRAVYGWYRRHKVAEVEFSDCKDGFLNVNTLDELEALEARLADSDPVT